LLPAGTEKCQATGKKCHRLEAVAARLGLTDEQKKDIAKICSSFHQQKAPLKEQLWRLYHEKRESTSKVLTEEQRARARQAIKDQWDKKWQAATAGLELTEEQRQRIDKVRQEYGTKFRELAAKKDSNREQLHRLRREKHESIRRELTAEQREKFHRLVRAEKRSWRNPAMRREFWKGVGEKMGVSAEQKTQLKTISREYARKMEKPASQLEQLRREQHAAVNKVLTKEQRAKLRRMREHRAEEKPTANG
jgi:Spy/CpxP family protein refolding chaperone